MKDRLNRTINYMRVSVTELCNLRCRYCMPEGGVQKKTHEEMLSIEELISITTVAVKSGINKIRITGGEPLLKKGLFTYIEQVSKLDINDFAMTTNGILLSEYAKKLKNNGINRINISLDTLDKNKYAEITRGGSLEQVLKGIYAAKDANIQIKINTVLMAGFNDNHNDIITLTDLVRNGIADELRFIEHMPFGVMHNIGFVSNDKVIDILNLKKADEKLINSPAKLYKTPDGVRIGLISPISGKFCSECNRIRITADGKLRTCLLLNDEHDMRYIVRNEPHKLEETFKNIILSKPEGHQLNNHITTNRNMTTIGG